MKSSRQQNDFFFKKIVVGPMGVNCYIIADPVSKKACVVDPGADGRVIKKVLDKEGFGLEFVINTHGHGDHIADNGYFGCPIYIHRLDNDFLTDPEKNMSRFLFFNVKSPKASKLLEDGDKIGLGSLSLEIIHTPGHTPGSISIKIGGTLLTGDTLFKEAVGRTDLEYGDEEALMHSIRDKLLTFSDDTPIYPGHGDESTIGAEKRNNPFLI